MLADKGQSVLGKDKQIQGSGALRSVLLGHSLVSGDNLFCYQNGVKSGWSALGQNHQAPAVFESVEWRGDK